MFKKILVRTPNWLGDAVMSIPAIKGIKRKYPESELSVLTRSNLSELWKMIPEVNSVYKIEEGLKNIKNNGFGEVYILTNSFRSALQMFRTGIPNRKGYSVNVRRVFLTRPVKLVKKCKEMHQIDYFLGLIDDSDKNKETVSPQIDITNSIKNTAKSILKSYGWKEGETVFGFHATASYGSAKCWLPERYGDLIKEVINVYNPWIVLCGTDNEKKAVDSIIKQIPSTKRIINLAGKTDISALAGTISLCKVFIANDSGPMHIAGAVGVPVIALFGSTDPSHTGPLGKRVIIKKDMFCSPCFKRECGTDLGCMKLIEVKEVMESIKEIINGTD